MKSHLTLAAVLALLFLTAPLRADVAPIKPPALDHPPSFGPLPIAIAGIVLSLAIGVAGFLIARQRLGIGLATFAVTAVVLVATAALVYQATQAAEEHARLKARYERELANFRPGGVRPPPPPPPPPPVFDTLSEPVATMAFAPTSSFPSSIPWAALVMNHGRTRPSQ
jgi:hypothetical protein